MSKYETKKYTDKSCHAALVKFQEVATDTFIFLHGSDIIELSPVSQKLEQHEDLGECFLVVNGLQNLSDDLNSRVLEDLIEQGSVEKRFISMMPNGKDIKQFPMYALTKNGVALRNDLISQYGLPEPEAGDIAFLPTLLGINEGEKLSPSAQKNPNRLPPELF